MEQAHIAELNPELPALESKQFRATVTLIWPYSSSARQFAILLAEPDFRLRRKNGQVRARFSGASAKALATTGVGIGDEVVLSLRGAHFVKEGIVSTPGKSIEWELEYSQTAAIQVFRNGDEVANIELLDAAPTPASPSPVRREPVAAPTLARQYSSPAFLKRARLSHGPFFEPPYDPLVDETEDGHDKKRRRKSYRDWKAWTYSARTPSPEKEDMTLDDELELLEASPSRAAQLPHTPMSPSRPEMLSVAAAPLREEETERHELQRSAEEAVSPVQDEDTRKSDAEYHNLYADPDEHSASDAQYAFGGDTEVDTEVNTEEEGHAQGENEGVSMSTTEADERAATITPPSLLDAPRITMPPPTSSALQTDLQSTAAVGLLTPIGREPASPTLRPQDSATLPFPSPFPGEPETSVTSYFDHHVVSEQTVEMDTGGEEEQNLPSEASYIGETSFFSSIGSSRASVFHPNHESAFTPVRFTFGMDGAGFSRPMELSSPPPEASPDKEHDAEPELSASVTMAETTAEATAAEVPSAPTDEVDVQTADESVQEATASKQITADVVMLSSGSEDEDDQSDTEELDQTTAKHMPQSYTDEQSENNAEIDLAQPADGSKDVEKLKHSQGQPPSQRSSPVGNRPPKSSPQEQDRNQDQSQSMDLGSNSEFVNLDFATETSNAIQVPDERTVTHTQSQEPEPSVDIVQLVPPFSINHSSEAISEATDEYLQDAFPMGHISHDFEIERQAELEQHPDVKMESIEDEAKLQLDEFIAEGAYDNLNTSADPTGEDSVTAPEEDHTMGEAQTVDVPLTVPAKNTRSKAKAPASPTPDVASVPNRTTRSTRSRGSVSSVARPVISPPRTRGRSAISPSQDATQTSPYSLRSQSNMLSPRESVFPTAATATRKSPQKSLQRSLDLELASATSHAEAPDAPSTSLQTSPGRYFDPAFLESTEEGAQSEYSVSFTRPSEEPASLRAMDSSSPAKRRPVGKEGKDSESVSSMDTGLKTRSGAKVERKKPSAKAVVEARSSQAAVPETDSAQPVASSPSRQLRSTGPIEPAVQSPRNVRRTRRQVYDLSESQESVGPSEKPNGDPPHGEGEGRQADPAQDSTVDADKTLRSSSARHGTDRKAGMRSNKTMTPEASQQTNMESQSSSTTAPAEQKSLPTPQLTQTTSAGLRSFQTDADKEDVTATSPTTKTSPAPKTISRRPTTAKDATTTTSTLEQPSIGLSTPLSYYTPLKDLLYFLNRTSQFHSPSDSSPDILALVTTGSSAPEKAKKGPKHWFTTLHITDLSLWPADSTTGTTAGTSTVTTTTTTTTTVQIFRPYASALPEAAPGDVILLRAFSVKSLNRQPMLISQDESAWCVWRWAGKPVWGAKRGAYGELRAREEVKGPSVERGEGEWREVERLRQWWVERVEGEVREREESGVKTRSRDKGKGAVE